MVLLGQALRIVGSPHLCRIYYGHLGPSGRWVLLHPWLSVPRAPRGMWRIDVLEDLWAWLLPLGFLPILRPGGLLIGSPWALPLLVAGPLLGPGGLYLYHFGAPIFPFLLFAAGSGIDPLPKSFG